MPPDLFRILNRQLRQIDGVDAAAMRQITDAYLLHYDRLRGDIDALRLAIEGLEKPTVAQIKALPQYKRLLTHSKQELDSFTNYVETQIATSGQNAVQLGLAHSAELVTAMTGGPYGGLRANVIVPLLDYLRRDGPLYARLMQITYATQTGVVDAIIQGVTLGYNPRKIAASIADAFGGGLTDALRNARTVQLYAYRDSARANYMASGGIVQGWRWWAKLDGLTCPVCISEHGTIHPLSEKLNGHYNCRCAAIPYIPELAEKVQSGEEWFKSLPAEQQRAILGNDKHAAYSAGKFALTDLKGIYNSPVYGGMVREKSLQELIP